MRKLLLRGLIPKQTNGYNQGAYKYFVTLLLLIKKVFIALGALK